MRYLQNRFDVMPAHVFNILVALIGQERHAYGIKDRISLDMMGAVSLPDSTFYPTLKRLLAADWIETTGNLPTGPGGKERPHYRLTIAGEERLRGELSRMKDMVGVTERRLLAAKFGVREQLY
jgi:DNA-binding PadR family transcriptional regulator